MSDWLPELRSGYDRATIRRIRLAFALSLALHAAVLWIWLPRLHFLSTEAPERGSASGPLIVQLAPRPSQATSPPPAPPPAPQVQARPAPQKPAPRPRAPAPKAKPLPPSPPPVVAMNKPAPETASPPAPPPRLDLSIPRAALGVPGDLSSYIETQRLARGEAMSRLRPYDTPVKSREETEDERQDRIIAANLGLHRTPTFGYDPKAGGGIFQIQHMGSYEAELIFFGWNRTLRGNTRQLFEVEKGDNPDIRIAVVRKVIAIIRESESGDFVWVSNRLGRDVTLSARPVDTAALEDFLMRDFFFGAVRTN